MLGNETVAKVANFTYRGPAILEKTYTGSFGAQQVCPFGACASSDSRLRVDITELVPLGMRVQVHATLVLGAVAGNYNIRPSAPAGDRVVDAGTQSTNKGFVEAFHIIHTESGPVELFLDRSVPDAGAFSLIVRGELEPTFFDELTPVAINVAPGTIAIAVEVATPGGDVRWWDAADKFQGNRSLSNLVLLPVTAPGELVLQFTGVSASVHLYGIAANGTTAPTLRLLSFKRTLGTSQTMTGTDAGTWTFDVDHVPLGAGAILGAHGGVEALFLTDNASLRVVSPDGLDAAAVEVSNCLCSATFEAGTYGSPHATAGHYTIHFTHQGSWNTPVTPFVDDYVRS